LRREPGVNEEAEIVRRYRVGFLRGATFNVYSGAQRLEPPGSAR